jgi:hypothetical protein
MNTTNRRRLAALAFGIASLVTSAARADVSLIVSAANLQDEGGTSAPPYSIALLVVDTRGDGFATLLDPLSPLSPGSCLVSAGGPANDLIIAKWDLSSLNIPGQLLNIATASPGATVASGMPLALYWFPSRTTAATIVGYTHYGIYTSAAAIDGSDPWVFPYDGSLVQLNFYTASRGGSNPDSAGRAGTGYLETSDPSQNTFLTCNIDGTNVVLTFLASPFVFYDVLTTTDLVSGSWSDIATNLSSGSGCGTMTFTNAGAATVPQRFYRLLAQ